MRTKLCIFISALMLMTACSSSSSSGYVDVSETQEKIEQQQAKQVSDTFEINDRGCDLLGNSYNFNGNEFMIWYTDEKKCIDLASGRVSSLCDIPGCAHDINTSKGCLEFEPMNNPVMTADGYYYTLYSDCRKLFYKSHGESKAVFENTFFSDLDKTLDPDNAGSFSYFFRDGVLYILGQNWFYTVDAKTMKQTCEPVIIGDSPRQFADVYGDHFYLVNENMELWHYDIKEKKLSKIMDKVWRIRACADGAYYNKSLGNDKLALYKCGFEGSGEKLVVDDAGAWFEVCEKSIYFAKTDGVYMFDKQSAALKKLTFELTYENGETYTMNDPRNIIILSCPSSQYVYVLDYSTVTGEKCCNALIRIKKDTSEYDAISLGIYYQPEGQNGSIISY